MYKEELQNEGKAGSSEKTQADGPSIFEIKPVSSQLQEDAVSKLRNVLKQTDSKEATPDQISTNKPSPSPATSDKLQTQLSEVS